VVRRNFTPVLFMPCPAGAEPLLQAEVAPLLADLPLHVLAGRGGVEVAPAQTPRQPAELTFDLSSELADTFVQAVFRLNLQSRLAQRVLWRVAYGPYLSEDHLYALARGVEWADWITPDQTLRVDVTARHSPLQSLQFAGLRIKDAVCDHLREHLGERPNVDTRHPHLNLHLHLDGDVAHLSIDTSGEALFKRGWREDKGEAPLKETLAAAMLAAAGWQGRVEDGPLLDPCCGSGTIAIEAAQMACGMAPGLLRHFAFEKHRPFTRHLPQWQQLRQQVRAQAHPPAVVIYAGDVSFRMTDFATRNAERAGVAHAIVFKTADALQRPAPETAGLLIFNPPYGERIEPKGTGRASSAAMPAVARMAREDFAEHDAQDFFSRLAAHWKRQYAGWTAWVLSPDMKLPSAMRLKESRRVVMFNGPIECRLFRFDLVAGSARSSAATEPLSPA
jgi:putative N6-adenine-specific DNA methylase